MTDLDSLKSQILALTREYSLLAHSGSFPASDQRRKPWSPEIGVPYAGRVFDENEVEAAVSSTLDFWLTLGQEGNSFESEIAEFLGIKKSLLVNSGSSANLIALSALTSAKVTKNRRIYPGDEVITVAAGFPTTVSPIVQVGAVPVFIDVDPSTGNVRVDQLQKSFREGKTKAVVLAHALGNPFNIKDVLRFCRHHDLWLVEDNCDALGCTYTLPREEANSLGIFDSSPGLNPGPEVIERWTGTWGDISTQSFYPPHHLTMGEGGAVNIVSSALLANVAESFRDWGRDCWCPSGKDNTCNKRFGFKLGDLPDGYDHKYTYKHLGYNLKPLDIQAAIGRVQLKKLPSYIKARKDNWNYLRSALDKYQDLISFSLPTHALGWNSDGSFEFDESGCMSNCSWFGFKISVAESAGFSRNQLAIHLSQHNIGNRMFFGGNLVKQPAFVDLLEKDPKAYRVACDLIGANAVMERDLFLGTYPGLSRDMLDYTIDICSEFFDNYI